MHQYVELLFGSIRFLLPCQTHTLTDPHGTKNTTEHLECEHAVGHGYVECIYFPPLREYNCHHYHLSIGDRYNHHISS